VSNRSKSLLRLLAAIVLGGAIMSEAFGLGPAEKLRKFCEAAVKCDTTNPSPSCNSVDYQEGTACATYIDGFLAGHNLGTAAAADSSTRICVPNDATISQLARVFVKYVNDHPEQLHQPDWAVLYVALKNAFPCE